jgi:multidrug efflux pump subunit AcrA (membrane-fusion protein)
MWRIAVIGWQSPPRWTLPGRTCTPTWSEPRRWRKRSQPIPVVGANVERSNTPLVPIGLGTVTRFNTATIGAQIAGLMTSVDFQEGQFVKKGDLLAEIDPRTIRLSSVQLEREPSRPRQRPLMRTESDRVAKPRVNR